jgi:RNA ligase
MGTVFHYDGAWRAASKGSFASEQAQWAQSWLDSAKPDGVLTPGLTYVAEILYPENRIVVNNGDAKTLVLLAVFNSDGVEQPLDWHAGAWLALGGRMIGSWPALPLTELVRRAAANTKLDGTVATGTDAEGWVIRFASGIRTKVKIADYVRVHALVTGTNERTIWEVLAVGHDPAELFDQVPDEFRDWAIKVAARLRSGVAAWMAVAQADFDQIGQLPDRKAFAEQAMKSDYRAALFRLYDGKDIEDLAWKSCKPRGDTPYAVDEEG